MIFISFYQFLGDHVPVIGALLTTLLFVAFLCFIFYKVGRRESDKAWRWDVEHNPKMLAQDIRESYEKRIIVLETRNSFLEHRQDVIVPAMQQMAYAMVAVANHLEEKK